MTQQDFLDEIKRTTSTSNPEVQENREAIRHLAEEIRDLKEQETEIERQPESVENSEQLEEINGKIDYLAEALCEFTDDVDTVLEELLQQRELNKELEKKEIQTEQDEEDDAEDSYGTEEAEEYSCRVCGETFDSERKRNGHEGGKHTVEERKEARTGSETLPADGITQREEAILQRLQDSNKQWLTASKIAENTDYKTTEIQNTYPQLKKTGMIETNKQKGAKLTDKGEAYVQTAEIEPEEIYECKVCGGDYTSFRGLASHLANSHGITSKDVEEDQLVTQVYRANGDENSGEQGGVEAPDNVEEEFPKFDQDEPVDAKHWTVEERVYLVQKVLEAAEKPLTRGELAKRIFNLDFKPEHGRTYYNVMMTPVRKLIDDGKVEEQPRLDINGQMKAYGLVDSSPEASSDEEDVEQQQKEDVDLEYALNQNDISRRELRSYKNTFTKIVYQTDHDGEVNYYDFSEHWGGDQKSLDAWRTIYQSPTILNTIREDVCDHLSFSWTAHSGGRKPTNWTLKIKS